jgi:hypothetical protein
MRMPKTPKAERKRPIVEEGRPSPPLKKIKDEGGVDRGVERKTGKTCMNAALCRGNRVNDIRLATTTRVQVDLAERVKLGK